LRPSSKAVCDRPYSRQRRPKYTKEYLGQIARALQERWPGIANEIWWGNIKWIRKAWNHDVDKALTMPLDNLPTLVGSDKEYVSIIVEARLKMGV
jgi:hypothetical protein